MSLKMVKLDDVCDFVRGPFGGSLKKEIFVSDGYPVYEQQHAIYNQFHEVRYFVDEEKFCEMNRFEIKPNDLIMSCSGTIGKLAIVPQDVKKGIINQALLKLTPNSGLDVKFLKLWLESDLFQYYLGGNSHGATIKNVASVSVLKEMPIPQLNIYQQKHIAKILDKAEALKQKRQQALALADDYLRATFLDLFGDPITNPKGWPVKKLSDVCAMDRQTITPLERNDLPYLGLEHIESQTGKILVNDTETIDHEVKGNSFHFNASHILYGKLRPYLNKVALPSFEGISSTELVPLKTDAKIANKYFVAWVLSSKNLVDIVMNANQGARMPRTNMNFMLSLEMGLPPKPEQDKFEQIVKKVEALETKMLQSQTEIDHLAKSLSQKAFRGELTGK